MIHLRRATVLVVGALLLRLVTFYFTSAPALAEAGLENRIRHRALYPARGEILDRNHVVLAAVRPGFEVWERTPDGREERALRNVPFNEALSIAWDLPLSPNRTLAVRPLRMYPQGVHLAHLVGTVGEIDRATLTRLGEPYEQGDILGRTGFERWFERRLGGRRGFEEIEVDAFGRVRRSLGRVPAKNGEQIRLTVRLDLALAAETALAGRRGAVVAIDPRSGDLLCSISSPGFDPNAFAEATRESLHARRAAFADLRAPLSDRALTGRYPPGSIFKVATILAGLRSGKIRRETRFVCGGYYQGKRCWNTGGHGALDASQAFAVSCNVWFYHAAEVTGTEEIVQTARELGIEGEIGDLGAASGLIPDPEWKRRERSSQAAWGLGDLLNLGIGQGAVLVTPIEAARMFATAVMGGRRMKIRVETARPQAVEADVAFAPSVVDFLRQAARRTVVEGTARGLEIPGVEVGGKTGTAQNPHGKPHAWVVAAAPIHAPEIVIAVVVENGGGGGAIAAPVARQVLEAWKATRLPASP